MDLDDFNTADWKYLLLSFDGRINRKPYWMGIIALIAVSIVITIISSILGAIFAPLAYLGTIASLATLYPSAALAAKRWHDRGKSGWWTLIALIPLLGALYMLWECGIQEGVPENNAYGANPLMAAA